jgi:hypothetical protein
METDKCPICYDILSLPVILHSCRCTIKHYFCLTCIRDGLGLNKHECKTVCPFCKEELHKTPENPTVYLVDDEKAKQLDNIHGEITCPRDCEWQGLRIDLRYHLKNCENSYRYLCKGCKKLFTKKEFFEHIENNCTDHNWVCVQCQEVFNCYSEFKLHKH